MKCKKALTRGQHSCLAGVKLALLVLSMLTRNQIWRHVLACWHNTNLLTSANEKQMLAFADKSVICWQGRAFPSTKAPQILTKGNSADICLGLLPFAGKNQSKSTDVSWHKRNLLNLASSNDATLFIKSFHYTGRSLAGAHFSRVSNFSPETCLSRTILLGGRTVPKMCGRQKSMIRVFREVVLSKRSSICGPSSLYDKSPMQNCHSALFSLNHALPDLEVWQKVALLRCIWIISRWRSPYLGMY